MRHQPRDRQALRSRRLGRTRLTRVPFPLFLGLGLHLVATPSGLPAAFALAGAKAGERDVCAGMIDQAGLARPGQTLIADNRYRSEAFKTTHRPDPARSLAAYDHQPLEQTI